jgi:hypothetical protein
MLKISSTWTYVQMAILSRVSGQLQMFQQAYVKYELEKCPFILIPAE